MSTNTPNPLNSKIILSNHNSELGEISKTIYNDMNDIKQQSNSNNIEIDKLNELLSFIDEKSNINLSEILTKIEELFNKSNSNKNSINSKYNKLTFKIDFTKKLLELFTKDLLNRIKENDEKTDNVIDNFKTFFVDLSKLRVDYFKGDLEDKDLNNLYYTFDSRLMKFGDSIIMEIGDSDISDEQSIKNNSIINLFKDPRFLEIQCGTSIKLTNEESYIDAHEFRGTATKAKYADLAEYYEMEELYKPGTLVGINIDEKLNKSELTKFINEDDTPYVGVISTNPGFVLNDKDDCKGENGFYQPVALKGRVPILLSDHCSKGDNIYKDKDGKAKASKSLFDILDEEIIGKALSDSGMNEGLIKTEIFVK